MGPSPVREVAAVAAAVVVAVVAKQVEPATARYSVAPALHNPQRLEVRREAAAELELCHSSRPNRPNAHR